MKTEHFYDRYNEIMYDERDAIVHFLESQADNRYGHQKYSYAITPLELNTHRGKLTATGVVLTYDNDLMIETNAGLRDYCAFDYGELSKIIEALPDAEKITLQTAYDDFEAWCKEHIDVDLDSNPFVWNDGKSTFEVHSISLDQNKTLCFEVKEITQTTEGWGLWNELSPNVAKQLRDHVAAEMLRRSNEYKKLREQLSWYGNDIYNFVEHGTVGQVMITINGTDIELQVLDICVENGELNVTVDATETGLIRCDNDYLTLKECDLTKSNLREIVEFFSKNINIIDAYNGHNPELVEKINKAWNDPKYTDRFGVILLALLTRDQKEYEDTFNTDAKLTRDYAIDHAHEIMEGVGDDWDLETILSFIRYE